MPTHPSPPPPPQHSDTRSLPKPSKSRDPSGRTQSGPQVRPGFCTTPTEHSVLPTNADPSGLGLQVENEARLAHGPGPVEAAPALECGPFGLKATQGDSGNV